MEDSKKQRGSGRKRIEEGNAVLEKIAKEALSAFRSDAKKEYESLVAAYEGASASIGVFGLGSVTVAVREKKAGINPPANQCPPMVGRAAVRPETVVAISEGKVTVLDAYHKGDLIVRAESGELHKAYGFLVKFSDAALRSEKLQKVFKDFRKNTGW